MEGQERCNEGRREKSKPGTTEKLRRRRREKKPELEWVQEKDLKTAWREY